MMKKQLLLLTILFVLTSSLCATNNKEGDVDHLALATLMLYDAKYDKAHKELTLVDKNKEGFDGAKYYTTYGVLYSKQGEHKNAIEKFKKAIEATKTKKFTAPKITKKEKYLFSIGGSKEEATVEPEYDPEAVRQEKIEQLYLYLSQEYYRIKDYKRSSKSG